MLTYDSSVVSGLKIVGAAIGSLDNGILSISGLKGGAGSQGPPGQDGEQGIQGPAGADGAQGIQGPAGADGAQGIQGPAGADGAQGIQGPAGADGAQGIQGPAGADGTQGPPGADGASSAVQSVAVGGSSYTANDITTLSFTGQAVCLTTTHWRSVDYKDHLEPTRQCLVLRDLRALQQPPSLRLLIPQGQRSHITTQVP